MAWLMGQGDHAKQVDGIWFKKPEDEAKFREHMMFVQEEMLVGKSPNLKLFFTKGLLVPPPPPEILKFFIPKKMKKIRHVMGSIAGTLFSDTAKDIVEEIEPGVHGFYPIEVEGLEERGFQDQYYIVNIRSRLKAVVQDVPQSQKFFSLRKLNYQDENFEDYYFKMSYSKLALQNDQPNIFVKKSVVEGRALWAEYGVPISQPAFFACDEFVKRLGRAGFGGISPDVKVGEL